MPGGETSEVSPPDTTWSKTDKKNIKNIKNIMWSLNIKFVLYLSHHAPCRYADMCGFCNGEPALPAVVRVCGALGQEYYVLSMNTVTANGQARQFRTYTLKPEDANYNGSIVDQVDYWDEYPTKEQATLKSCIKQLEAGPLKRIEDWKISDDQKKVSASIVDWAKRPEAKLIVMSSASPAPKVCGEIFILQDGLVMDTIPPAHVAAWETWAAQVFADCVAVMSRVTAVTPALKKVAKIQPLGWAHLTGTNCFVVVTESCYIVQEI